MRRGYSIRLGLLFLVLVSCASTKPIPVYEPIEDQTVYLFYSEGKPYALASYDCATIVAAFEPQMLGDHPYLSVFLEIENSSEEPYLFEPLKDLLLNCEGDSRTYDGIEPVSPTEVLARLKNQQSVNMLSLAFAGALQGALARPTTITGPGGTWTVNDVASKQEAITGRTTANVLSYAAASSMEQTDVSNTDGEERLQGRVAVVLIFPPVTNEQVG